MAENRRVYVSPQAKRLGHSSDRERESGRPYSSSDKVSRERVHTLSAAHRRRLDTSGQDDRARNDGGSTPSVHSLDVDDAGDPVEHGDDVLNGAHLFADAMDTKDDSGDNGEPPRPTFEELLEQSSLCEFAKQAMEIIYERQQRQQDRQERHDEELGRHGKCLKAQGQRLGQIEAGLPSRLCVFPKKGGSLQSLRQLLGNAFDNGHFKGQVRGLNNWFEAPIYLDLANPGRSSVCIQMVLELDPDLHPYMQGASKVRRQNEQASAMKDACIQLNGEFIKKTQGEAKKYYFDVSWPAGLQIAENADSWSVSITPDAEPEVVLTCSYDHDLFEQEFSVDLRVARKMGWDKNHFRHLIDQTLDTYQMYKDKILWVDGRAPLLEVEGKQKHLPRGGGKGQSTNDVTPNTGSSPPRVLSQAGIPSSFSSTKGGKPHAAPQSAPYRPKGGARPGDFTCGGCGEYNFAKNLQCRRCFAPKSQCLGKGTAGGFPLAPPPPPRPPAPPQQPRGGQQFGGGSPYTTVQQHAPYFPPPHPIIDSQGVQNLRGKAGLTEEDLAWMKAKLAEHSSGGQAGPY